MFQNHIDLSSLSLFYRDVRRIPRMTREKEMRLARQWRERGDREAARELVVANLYGVAAIAREYRHFGLPEMDLIQEGTLGLMHAVKRFDPERGFRLMTYAGWWVRASMQEFILRSWSIVKLGTSKLQRRIFAGLQHARNSIAALEGHKADEVAADYGLSAAEYQEAAAAYLQRDLSIDADSEGYALVHALPSNDPTPEEQLIEAGVQEDRHERLATALATLSERDRAIVARRHMSEEPATLKELAEEYGVSIERVRQLESRAMQRLRSSLQE